MKEILLRRYPHLAQVPKDAPDGIDTPLPPPPRIRWSDLGVGHLIPLTDQPQWEEVEGDAEGGQVGENDEANVRLGAETQVKLNGEEGSTGKGNEASRGQNRSVDAGANLQIRNASDSKEEAVDSADKREQGVPEREQYAATWHDVALSIAGELMDQARGKVREMGYTTSAVRFSLLDE